jgi:hypothetical protein
VVSLNIHKNERGNAEWRLSYVEAATHVGLHPDSVRHWRQRWATGDFCLRDEPGRGRHHKHALEVFPNRRPLTRRAFGYQDVLGFGRPTKPAHLLPDGADSAG